MDIRELRIELDDLAHDLAIGGLGQHREALGALAHVTAPVAPAAAAVLTDEHAADVVRLRAFGVLHGVALHQLDHDAQEALLLRLHPAPAYHLVA